MAALHPAARSCDSVTTVEDGSLSRLLSTIATVLDVDASVLSDEVSPGSIEAWDSLNHLNIAMAVESEFGVSFSAQQVMDMGSIGLIREALREQGVNI
jgi:acyl carrier protein